MPEGRRDEDIMCSSRVRLLSRPERAHQVEESPRQLQQRRRRKSMALAAAGQPSPSGDGAAAATAPAATASSRFRAFEAFLQKW